jgi:hypothetical protein
MTDYSCGIFKLVLMPLSTIFAVRFIGGRNQSAYQKRTDNTVAEKKDKNRKNGGQKTKD